MICPIPRPAPNRRNWHGRRRVATPRPSESVGDCAASIFPSVLLTRAGRFHDLLMSPPQQPLNDGPFSTRVVEFQLFAGVAERQTRWIQQRIPRASLCAEIAASCLTCNQNTRGSCGRIWSSVGEFGGWLAGWRSAHRARGTSKVTPGSILTPGAVSLPQGSSRRQVCHL